MSDITPKNKSVPALAVWSPSEIKTIIDEQNQVHSESIHDLEQINKIKLHLDAECVHNNIWPTDLFSKIYTYSYPLRGIIKTDITITYLDYLEIYSKVLIPSQIAKVSNHKNDINKRARAKAEGRGTNYVDRTINLLSMSMRTFHVHDNCGVIISSLQLVIPLLERKINTRVHWDWVATYEPTLALSNLSLELAKNSNKWFIGVDSRGTVNIPNMRAWHNKILTNIKSSNIIISGGANNITNVIAFSLINLEAEGSAMIYIPSLSGTSIISMIHLFSQCFESTQIYHTTGDKIFLCGVGFLNCLTLKHHKLLYEFCNIVSADVSPFTQEYINSPEFTETVNNLMKVNNVIQGWRYDYYEKIIECNFRLSHDISALTFDDYADTYLRGQYPDESVKWAAATGFNL